MYLGLTAEVKIQIFNGFHLPIRMHFAHAEFIYALVDTRCETIEILHSVAKKIMYPRYITLWP